MVGIAILSLAGSISIAWPARLKTYREHKRMNSEVLRLQADINHLQGRIRGTQTELLRVQAQLGAGK